MFFIPDSICKGLRAQCNKVISQHHLTCLVAPIEFALNRMIYHCNGGLTITSPIVSCEMEAGFQRRQAELSCHYSHLGWKHMFTGRITWTTCLATTHLQDLVHACLQRSMPNLCRQCTFHLKCMATCCDSCLASRWGLEGHRLLSGVLFIDVSLSSNYAEIFRIVRFNCVCHLELQNLKAS